MLLCGFCLLTGPKQCNALANILTAYRSMREVSGDRVGILKDIFESQEVFHMFPVCPSLFMFFLSFWPSWLEVRWAGKGKKKKINNGQHTKKINK